MSQETPENDAPNRDAWETPPPVVAAVSAFMGRAPWIDLCASAENRKAPLYIGEGVGGFRPGPVENVDPGDLMAESFKRGPGSWAWMNPPYSRNAIARCLDFAARYAEAGGVVAVLVNLDESTGWFRRIRPYIVARLIPPTRIQFLAPEGVIPSRNSRAQTIYILATRSPWDPPGFPTYDLPTLEENG